MNRTLFASVSLCAATLLGARCRFELAQPISGKEGGGQGQCQVAGGDTIDAVFTHG